MKCADMFCGIGGFHLAANNLGLEVVFACDIDKYAREAYRANFGLLPASDITLLEASEVPDHDLLFAGFPCQPFSIIGKKMAFDDPRGLLFFELLRFINEKQPKGIILENVKQFATANKGLVIRKVLDELSLSGYTVDYRVLNALDFGLPQKRERTIIVATKRNFLRFPWPDKTVEMTPLSELLEEMPDQKYFVSDYIRRKRHQRHRSDISPSIWHENKGGNISSHPWSCALRAGASHNYLLVDGKRRLTPRELLRLQGFPDTWKIVCSDAQTRRQAGNAVPVPMVRAVMERMVNFLEDAKIARQSLTA